MTAAMARAELIQRRPDLKPMYAVIENIVGNGEDVPSAKALAQAGAGVCIWGTSAEKNAASFSLK